MRIVICSAFRNATSYIGRYFEQMDELREQLWELDHTLFLSMVHGDSIDGTSAMLWEESRNRKFGCILQEYNHRGKHYPSVVHPIRFQQLARVSNKMWSCISSNDDVVFMLDADLIWKASTLVSLIDRLQEVPVVAPKVLHHRNPGFYMGEGPFWYDTFAFRRNGATFRNEPPYYPALEHIASKNGGLVQLDSAGACLALRANIAQGLTFPEEDVVVGLCKQVYERGHSVWLDNNLAIYHP